MCGIFGFVGKSLSPKTLRSIATATERRGPHAFGFAWIDSDDRLHAYRQAGRITDHLGLLAMARDAKMLIGHCRYATAGDPRNNINNHPHPCDGGWLVHNGVVANYEEIVADHGLVPQSECDSEAIALLVERAEGDHVERVVRAVDCIRPEPAVVACIWPRPARVVLVRRSNPLNWTQRKEGFYFASVATGFAVAHPVANHTATEFRIRKSGRAQATVYEF